MLWNSSAINGYHIHALDGNLGTVSDILFGDNDWTARWVVVDTGNWLPGRKVLLPLSALGEPDRDLQILRVNLTMQQVKNSPDIDTNKSVSRQHETQAYDFYGFDPYWGGVLYAPASAMAVPYFGSDSAAARHDSGDADAMTRHAAGNPHLRSVASVTGYHIHASDGEIGHAAEFLINDQGWTIGYIIVDTRNWWPGELVLIAPRSIQDIDWAGRLINLNVSRQMVRESPNYHRNMTVDGAFESQLNAYYTPGFPIL